ncbi:MAG: nucleotidyltransferase [Firmicutes bacterium]|nr:nucleotidyltransferase [Bacillota bacterium]
MTLVVLAAGIGSRYGGFKQIDPISKYGDFIIDYSVYDAIKAGFDRVVFIIKPEMQADFDETIGKRIKGKIKVEYAYQTLDKLPDGLTVPEGRTKPWGTSHALVCAEDVIGDDKFAVINSDDFYGRDMFMKIAEFMRTHDMSGTPASFAMVGYILKNTMSPNGTVTRGICKANSEGKLTEIAETFKIRPNHDIPEGAESFENETWVPLDENSIASMNCWGMSKAVFPMLRQNVVDTINGAADKLKCEALLPTAVFNMITAGKCTVEMLTSDAVWYGVTVREDKPSVQAGIGALIESGVYPENLWG